MTYWLTTHWPPRVGDSPHPRRIVPRSALVGLLLLAGSFGAAPRLAAQPGTVRGLGVVVGTVRDSVSGELLVNALVSVRCTGCSARAYSDSTGAFRLERLPEGRLTLALFCPSRTLIGSEIGMRDVVVASAAEARLDVRVPPGVCVEAPYAERTGVFRGHWSPGFESSKFVPCRDAAIGLADGLEGLLPGKRPIPASAWVTFAQQSHVREGLTWPEDAPRDRWDRPKFYVVWHGTLRGPGTYGHMGVAAFEFTADSVIAARRPSPDDCR